MKLRSRLAAIFSPLFILLLMYCPQRRVNTLQNVMDDQFNYNQLIIIVLCAILATR